MTDLRAGDTVRLKRPYAAALTRKRPNFVDWVKRRGIIKRIGVRSPAVYVMWPGCKTPDALPFAAVERCP